MLNTAFHRLFSLVMAFLVLFSTVSFTVDQHFCGDMLIDTSIFTQTQKCKMETFEMEEMAMTKMNCCKDKLEIIKGQDQLKLSKFEDLNLDQQFFLTNLIYTFNILFEGLPKQIIPHKDYSPPNLVADLQILDQVFLI